MTERLAVTVPEACKMLGISRASLYRLFKDGRLRKTPVAGRTLVRMDDLRRLLDEASSNR